MDLKAMQGEMQQSVAKMKAPFRSGTEIMLALTEEVGEVAREVALLEQVGSKAEWSTAPSIERLAKELTHVLSLSIALANFYAIDLDQTYANWSQA